MTMTLTYIIKDILLSNYQKVLTAAHCLLKSYKRKKLDKYNNYY